MFPTADAARILSTTSNSYDALVSRAFDVIMAATRNGANEADLPYEGVSAETHAQFHSFIVTQGFRGGQSRVDNHMIYRIRW